MIAYSEDAAFFWAKRSGSVFPKAAKWALSGTLAALALSLGLQVAEMRIDVDGLGTSLGGFQFVLTFMLVFRTQIAYKRFWEGLTLLQQMRGTFFNATSNLFAFSSYDPGKRQGVEEFQQELVRLISLLHCAALQDVCDLEDMTFVILDSAGIEQRHLQYLKTKEDFTEKLEIILLWIQRLIIMNISNGVIPTAPPIVSRVFQEFSNGIIMVNDAKKMKEVPFPFPYSQMLKVMLLLNWILTPIVTTIVLHSWIWAGTITFVSTSLLFSCNYVAMELEMPFGNDANDLPTREMQNSMNSSLENLLEECCQLPPSFNLKEAMRAKRQGRLPRAYSRADGTRKSFSSNPELHRKALSRSEHAKRSLLDKASGALQQAGHDCELERGTVPMSSCDDSSHTIAEDAKRSSVADVAGVCSSSPCERAVVQGTLQSQQKASDREKSAPEKAETVEAALAKEIPPIPTAESSPLLELASTQTSRVNDTSKALDVLLGGELEGLRLRMEDQLRIICLEVAKIAAKGGANVLASPEGGPRTAAVAVCGDALPAAGGSSEAPMDLRGSEALSGSEPGAAGMAHEAAPARVPQAKDRSRDGIEAQLSRIANELQRLADAPLTGPLSYIGGATGQDAGHGSLPKRMPPEPPEVCTAEDFEDIIRKLEK